MEGFAGFLVSNRFLEDLDFEKAFGGLFGGVWWFEGGVLYRGICRVLFKYLLTLEVGWRSKATLSIVAHDCSPIVCS